MKIVHFSDTHNRHNQMEQIPCDLVICSGDFSATGQKSEVKSFLKWFKNYPTTYRIFIAGNHDICFDDSKNEDGEKPDWLKDELGEYLKYDCLNFYLEDSGCQIEGINFWGSPATPRYGSPMWAFNYDRGWSIKQVWNKIPEDTNVLITHGPAKGRCDFVPGHGHQGCEDLAETIRFIEPEYHLFGHIHESYGYYHDEFRGIKHLNGSMIDIVNGVYVVTHEPHRIEIK